MLKKVFLLSFVLVNQQSFAKEDVLVHPSSACGSSSQIFHQPAGTFALMLNCQESLGAYATVIYWAPMTIPKVKAWDVELRFWTNSVWEGVTNFAWKGSDTLYIASEYATGNANIYKLDLYNKKVEAILKVKDFEGKYVIKDIKDNILYYTETLYETNKTTDKQVLLK
jgi:hypothetical protein